VLRPQGYSTIDDPDAPRPIEYDTAMCGHCQRVIFTKPGSASTVYIFLQPDGRVLEEAGAMCHVCWRPVCLTCHDHGRCIPFEKTLELAEAKAETRRSIEETLGRSR